MSRRDGHFFPPLHGPPTSVVNGMDDWSADVARRRAQTRGSPGTIPSPRFPTPPIVRLPRPSRITPRCWARPWPSSSSAAERRWLACVPPASSSRASPSNARAPPRVVPRSSSSFRARRRRRGGARWATRGRRHRLWRRRRGPAGVARGTPQTRWARGDGPRRRHARGRRRVVRCFGRGCGARFAFGTRACAPGPSSPVACGGIGGVPSRAVAGWPRRVGERCARARARAGRGCGAWARRSGRFPGGGPW